MKLILLALALLCMVPPCRAQGTAPELILQVGHTAAVRTTALSEDGTLLATGSLDGTAKLWDAKTFSLLYSLPHGAPVLAVRFGENGQLVTAASGGTIRFWNPATGALRRITPGSRIAATAAALSPDCKLAAFGLPDGKILLRETETGRAAATLDGHPTPLKSLAFSPDGKRLASTSEAFREKPENPEFARPAGDLRIWEIPSGDLLKILRGHALTVFNVAWSPDGKQIASVGESGTAVIWDAEKYTKLNETNISKGQGAAYSVAFVPGQSGVIAGWRGGYFDGSYTLKNDDWRNGPIEPVTAIQPLPNRLVMVGRRDGSILWTGIGDRLQHRTTNQMAPLLRVRVSPDGKTIATAGANGVVCLWNFPECTLRRAWRAERDTVKDIAFSPDSKTIATAGTIGIGLYNVSDGHLLLKYLLMGESASALAFSPDGKKLAAGISSLDGVGIGCVQQYDIGPAKRTYSKLSGTNAEARWVAFTPDGDIASVWGRGLQGTLLIWDKAGNVRLKENFRGGAGGALSPNGRRLITAGALLDEHQDYAFAGEQLQLWNLTAMEKTRLLETKAEDDRATDVAISPDGNQIASAGRDGNVRLWDPNSSSPRVLTAHTGPVNAVTFSPGDRPFVVSAGADGTVRVWNGPELKATLLTLPVAFSFDIQTVVPDPLSSRSPLLAVTDSVTGQWVATGTGSPPPVPLDWVATTPAGYYAASAGAGRYLQYRVGPDVFPVEAFSAGYLRPELGAQVREDLHHIVTDFETGNAVPPQATILLPKAGDSASSPLQVHIEATDDQSVKSVQLLVDGRIAATKTLGGNGKPLEVGAKPLEVGAKALFGKPLEVGAKPLEMGAKPLPAGHKAVWDVDFTANLPGGGEGVALKAIVTDNSGLQAWDEIRLRPGGGTSPRGKLFVLSVGVSAYANPNFNLRFAADDATAFAGLWQAQQGRQFGSVTVNSLTDGAATSTAVSAALQTITRSAGPQDTIAIFLSGHGLQAAPGEYYFATHDVNPGLPATTALPWTVLRTTLATSAARRVILFLDACHSGNALGGQAAGNEGMAAQLAQNAGVVVFASSLGSQYSYELPELKHGAFTQALIQGVGRGYADLDTGTGKDGVVNVEELLTYLRALVPSLTNGMQMPACPLLQDFGEPFALARTK